MSVCFCLSVLEKKDGNRKKKRYCVMRDKELEGLHRDVLKYREGKVRQRWRDKEIERWREGKTEKQKDKEHERETER